MAEQIKDLIGGVADKAINAVGINSVWGEPMTVDGVTLIPVYKTSLGFGGGGFTSEKDKLSGGAGAGTTVTPVSYLYISEGKVKLVAADAKESPLVVLLKKASEMIKKKKETDKANV